MVLLGVAAAVAGFVAAGVFGRSDGRPVEPIELDGPYIDTETTQARSDVTVTPPPTAEPAVTAPPSPAPAATLDATPPVPSPPPDGPVPNAPASDDDVDDDDVDDGDAEDDDGEDDDDDDDDDDDAEPRGDYRTLLAELDLDDKSRTN